MFFIYFFLLYISSTCGELIHICFCIFVCHKYINPIQLFSRTDSYSYHCRSSGGFVILFWLTNVEKVVSRKCVGKNRGHFVLKGQYQQKWELHFLVLFSYMNSMTGSDSVTLYGPQVKTRGNHFDRRYFFTTEHYTASVLWCQSVFVYHKKMQNYLNVNNLCHEYRLHTPSFADNTF